MNALTTIATAALLTACSCYSLTPMHGGSERVFQGPRSVRASDVALADGYRIAPVVSAVDYPIAVLFDARDHAYLVESGLSYGGPARTPRLLRVEDDGGVTAIAHGEAGSPWTGAASRGELFYIVESGATRRILEVNPLTGKRRTIVTMAQNGAPELTPLLAHTDGSLYVAEAALSNSGVIGAESLASLQRNPQSHDTTCRPLTIRGEQLESVDLLHEHGHTVKTGAFAPFGSTTPAGTTTPAALPCSGSLMKIAPNGQLSLVAWGFRAPSGLASAPDGHLFVVDRGYEARGSRPVFGAADSLWRVNPAGPPVWFGWPDFSAALPLSLPRFKSPDGPQPTPLLASYPNNPPEPFAHLPVFASSSGSDLDRAGRFGFPGSVFIAEFGDLTPAVGHVMWPVGFMVVRVDPEMGRVYDFAANRGERNGPASWLGAHGLERPIDVRFNRSGRSMYVVDYGVVTVADHQILGVAGTGVLWKIEHTGA